MSDGDGVLSSSSFLSSDGGNLSSLCPNGSEWIWYELGECTQDVRDMISVVLGLLSIACFIVSSFPMKLVKRSYPVTQYAKVERNSRNDEEEGSSVWEGLQSYLKGFGTPKNHSESYVHYVQMEKLGTVVNLPRSGRSSQIPHRAQRRLIQQVTQGEVKTTANPEEH